MKLQNILKVACIIGLINTGFSQSTSEDYSERRGPRGGYEEAGDYSGQRRGPGGPRGGDGSCDYNGGPRGPRGGGDCEGGPRGPRGSRGGQGGAGDYSGQHHRPERGPGPWGGQGGFERNAESQ